MKRLFVFICLAAIISCIFGTIYATTQQAQRSDANFPQIQLAEDTQAALNSGQQPDRLIGEPVDIGSSLAPFLSIYDQSGRLIASSARLHGETPAIPSGVLQAARGQLYHAVTWQPATGVRIATVTTSGQHYFVLSGRSLTEVERNENRTMLLAALGWAVSELCLAAAFLSAR